MTGTRPIGILCALPQEQALLVAAMGEPSALPGSGLEARSGRLDGREVVVAASGVGKVRAATAATVLVERYGCGALVLSGVAGGLGASLDIGDVVIAERVIDIDYGRLTPAGRIVYQPGTLPVPEVEPQPGYLLSAELRGRIGSWLASGEPGARRFAVALGTVLTTDSYLASPVDRDQLAEAWAGLAIEMEGAALCGVAEHFGLPWLVVRALSDRAGEESLTDFAAFLQAAAEASARVVRDLLPLLDGGSSVARRS